MQNERSFDVAPDPTVQANSAAGVPPPQATSVRAAAPPQGAPIALRASPYVLPAQARRSLWKVIAIGLALALGVVGGIIALITQLGRQQQVQSGEYSVIKLPLGDLTDTSIPIEDATSLKINGQLDVSGSMVFSPSAQPKNPLIGQLYFDQTSNRLSYYDGQQFLTLGGQSTGTSTQTTNTTNNVTNVTNILGGSGNSQTGVELQATAPGAQQTGSFNVSGTGQVGALKTPTIENNGPVSVRSDSFFVQNTSGQNLIAADASAGSLALTGLGTGTISVSTAANTGVTGNIVIKSGDSSTTASGDITIDAGSGIVSGTVVSTKTFESGTDHMVDWFNTTVAQSSAQAHTGTHSLGVTMNDSFWGIQEDQNFALTTVVPGHNYHFSFWVKAGTNPRSISARAIWVSTGGQSTVLQAVVDSTTGWTEVTGNGVAPPGATNVYFSVSNSGMTPGEVHYFDDFSITDLSSSSATSVLHLGDTNAQIVNLGNLNQIGATTIRGGSGIDIQSGASSITMSGGVINITGNAASNLTTTAGALTINSAAAASWGVGQASSGVGGNLTLHAGTGGTDANNDGGDLILQGGNKNGTGIGGSVVVKPQSDATDAFQVQNSSGVAFLVADTTAMKISVTGTTTTFASLTLANAHFASTQTNPPTIGVPSNCGVTPTAVVTAGSTDTAGSFAITTGSGGTSSTCDVVFTFNRPYGAAPKSIMVVGKGDAASAARQAYVVSSNTTSFTLSFGASAAGANNTPYSFSYWVVE